MWQGRPTLKLPYQLTKDPLTDREMTLKVGRCQIDPFDDGDGHHDDLPLFCICRGHQPRL